MEAQLHTIPYTELNLKDQSSPLQIHFGAYILLPSSLASVVLSFVLNNLLQLVSENVLRSSDNWLKKRGGGRITKYFPFYLFICGH